MTVFLNVLFVAVAVLFFAGRLYEAMFLLEEGTNFLTRRGIVTTPVMLGIVFLISVCCGIIIFSNSKAENEKLKISVGMFGFIPALCFIDTAVLNIIQIFKTGGFLGYDIMMILASVGLIGYGMYDIQGKKREKLLMILTIMFPVAMCMNAVILDVQPISNTIFLYRSLSAVLCLAFFTLLFKNAYAPTNLSRPLLYVISQLNFLISSAATLAGLIVGFMNSSMKTSEMLLDIGLVVIGVYSLFVSFYITSSPKRGKAEKDIQKEDDSYTDRYEEPFYTIPEIKSVQEYETPAVLPQSAFAVETEYRQVNKISRDTIATLFAQKEEKQQKQTVETAVKSVTTELAVTQALEKQATDVKKVKTNSSVKPAESKAEKNVFKGTGKKTSAPQKVVYKAPKK